MTKGLKHDSFKAKNKPGQWRLILLIPVLLLILAVYSCWPASTSITPPLPPDTEADRYQSLISNWNQFAAPLSNHYTMTGEAAATPQGAVSFLNRLLSSLNRPWPDEADKELNRLSEEVPNSVFHEYAKFRREHQVSSRPDLSPDMEAADLSRTLNLAANIEKNGRPPNYLLPETVNNILYLYDFCTWFYGERNSLRQLGLAPGLDKCSEAALGPDYPALNALIDKNSPCFDR